MNYPRLLTEWRRINNVNENTFVIHRSPLKYINCADEWILLHKEGYSCNSIAQMYGTVASSVKIVFNEVGYNHSHQRSRSPYNSAAKIWRVNMQQGLTLSQISDIYEVSESIITRYVKRLALKKDTDI